MVTSRQILQLGVTKRQVVDWVAEGLLFPPTRGRAGQWPADTLERIPIIQDAMKVRKQYTNAGLELVLAGYVVPAKRFRMLCHTFLPAPAPVLTRAERRRQERFWQQRLTLAEDPVREREVRRVIGKAIRTASSPLSPLSGIRGCEGPVDDFAVWLGNALGQLRPKLQGLTDDRLVHLQSLTLEGVAQHAEEWRVLCLEVFGQTSHVVTQRVLRFLDHQECPIDHSDLAGLRWLLLVWGLLMWAVPDGPHGLTLASSALKAERDRLESILPHLRAPVS